MGFPTESYERFMVPALFAPWASRLVQAADVKPSERVLDVACGTGIVSRYVARQRGSQGAIVGLDLNPRMLSVARGAAEQGNRAIDWCAGRAERLPFPGSSFDLVVCQFGLMFFTDRHAALTEMRRALRPGGRIVLSAWRGLDHHPFYQTLHEVSQQRLGTSGVQAAFSLGDSDELRRLLTEAGYTDVEIESASITARFPNPEAFLRWEIDVDPAAVPALQPLDAQAQQAVLTAIYQEMAARLREVMQDDEAVLPFHAHVARARR